MGSGFRTLRKGARRISVVRDQLRWSHDLIDRTSPITSGMCEQRHRTRQSTGNIWELFGNLKAVRKTGKSYMTFCAIPWIHRHINEQGFHALCCVGVGDGNILKNARGERLHVSQELTDVARSGSSDAPKI